MYLWIRAKERICEWEARSEEVIQKAAQQDKQMDNVEQEAGRYGGQWEDPTHVWLEFQEGKQGKDEAEVIYFFRGWARLALS